MSDVDVFSTSIKQANTLNYLIREKLKSKSYIGMKDYTISTEQRVFLSKQEQKHAKYFKSGMVVKTYVGRGQFSERLITKIDEKNNRIMIKGAFGRERYTKPSNLLDNDTKLYQKGSLTISDGDRLKINSKNKLSKTIGLSDTCSYILEISESKAVLVPDNTRLKPVKIKFNRLNGLDIGYDYAKTLSSNHRMRKSQNIAILEAPSYILNKNILSEFQRTHKSLDIYTDNEAKAKKKLAITSIDELATSLTINKGDSHRTNVQKAVDYGLSIIASREAAFSYQSVIEKALSYELAQASFQDIKSELINRVKSNDLMVRQLPTGDILLATQESISLEKTIINQIKTGKDAVTPYMEGRPKFVLNVPRFV